MASGDGLEEETKLKSSRKVGSFVFFGSLIRILKENQLFELVLVGFIREKL